MWAENMWPKTCGGGPSRNSAEMWAKKRFHKNRRHITPK